MSGQPRIPPPPVRFPTRVAAPHVQAAVAQAKLPASPAPGVVAPHVQAAVAQARPASPPPPRPAAKVIPPPPARPPQAAHVQRALSTVQPKAPHRAGPPGAAPRVPNVPPPPAPRRPSQPDPSTVQLMKRTPSDIQKDNVKKKRKLTLQTPQQSFSLPFLPPTLPQDFILPPPTPVKTTSSPLLDLPPMLTVPFFNPVNVNSSISPISFTPLPPVHQVSTPSLTLVPTPKPLVSSVVKVYDPTTEELAELAQSAQNLFAYQGTDSLTHQRTIKLFDVKGLTFDDRSKGSVHAALQINHLTPMISKSGEYGTPTKVVRDWMQELTWKDEQGQTQTGFTSPSIGDSDISFTIPKKISKQTNKSGHRWSAHAEVNAYRELYKLYTQDQGTASSLVKFRMATNVAHCAECWWAAHALFTKLGIDLGKLETSSPTENVLFNQWTEPWEGFFQDLGMDSSPFRTKTGKLKKGFKRNKGADPLVLNSMQQDVTFS